MIIICPNCHTNYQVAQQAIGSGGRKVVCANCQQPWRATIEQTQKSPTNIKLVADSTQSASNELPKSDEIFSSEEEKALDSEFSKQEQIETNLAVDRTKNIQQSEIKQQDIAKTKKSELDKAIITKQKSDLLKRKNKIAKKMPLERIKKNSRLWLVLILLLMGAGGYYFRNIIVNYVPQFAKIYEIIGLKVNLVGLEFIKVQTLNIKDNGAEKLSISAKIHNITNSQVSIPQIIINLIDENENSLMQWSVTPMVSSLNAREILDFQTHLEGAPTGAATIKLSFVAD